MNTKYIRTRNHLQATDRDEQGDFTRDGRIAYTDMLSINDWRQ